MSASLEMQLEEALTDCNRSRQIIYEMAEALNPREGEHNIDCAKRVAAELSASQARERELVEIVRYVFADGRGREFFPCDLLGRTDYMFDKARALLKTEPEGKA